ncbi:class I SAM-dependent methyltransferase [Fulvivirgaceae bacterium BMA10]|uniref:Class I SAM-dependent methyltransferase n=1 Tax=Splendidivirga corallicola TaxID=3051826 RepID=A0ABT8KVA4_9BACT|nr:class I SAM-dependent methyltransferase [Fulvivirgaceae bacterium BMA10]
MFKKKKKNRTIDSKEVGLEAGLMIFKFFLKTEYLHYGYFTDGLEADVSNLKKAQENYAEMLFGNIPEGTKTILDVGCGSGKTAQELISRGYKVDCVSPSQILTNYAKTLVGEDVSFYQCKFENMEQQQKYDLVLFSESFQYIPMDQSIPKALKLLNKNGHIMICDFFKNDPEGKSLLGGGHQYEEWLQYKDAYSVKTLIERDITRETAPTIDIVNQLSMEVIKPIWTSVWALAEDRFPGIIKLVKRKYSKKINKMENKHFTGQRTAENFLNYKKYMFYLFQTENQMINEKAGEPEKLALEVAE